VPFRHVVLRVCRNALMGQLLTVWRTASNLRRPYLDVRDDVDALSFIVGAQLFDGRICNVETKNATVKMMRDIITLHRPGVATRCVKPRCYCTSPTRFGASP